MTCIVGLEHGGKVYIGGDSAGVAGWSLTVRGDSKVFTRSLKDPDGILAGTMVIGFTTSFRMGQIVQHVLEIPPVPRERDAWLDVEEAEAWMVKKLIPALRACFETEGYQKKENERAEGGTFLVGLKGHLLCVEGDYQVARPAARYDAIGCGGDIAVGALHALPLEDHPEENVLDALKAAETHNAGVRGPFKVVSA